MHCAPFQRNVREMSLVVLYVYLHTHKHTYTNEENHENYLYGQWEWATHRAHFQRSVREISLVVLYVCVSTCTQTHMYQQQRKSWTVCIRSVRESDALRTFPKKCARDESRRVVCMYIYLHTNTHIPTKKILKSMHTVSESEQSTAHLSKEEYARWV